MLESLALLERCQRPQPALLLRGLLSVTAVFSLMMEKVSTLDLASPCDLVTVEV